MVGGPLGGRNPPERLLIGLDHGVVGRGGLQFVDSQDAVIASRIAWPVAEVVLHRLDLLQNRPVGVRAERALRIIATLFPDLVRELEVQAPRICSGYAIGLNQVFPN